MRVEALAARATVGSRAEQQDAAAHRSRGRRFAVAAVCDGVGATPRARLAAEHVASAAVDYLSVLPRRRRSVGRFLVDLPAALAAGLGASAAEGRLDHGSATTLLASAIDRGLCWTVSVGDSAAFLVRAGGAVAATPRASVAAARAAGLLSDDGRDGTELVRWVSADVSWTAAEPIVSCWPVEPGDLVVLATDGVTESVPPWELARVATAALRDGLDPCGAIIDLVGERRAPGSDNATVAALLVSDPSPIRRPRRAP